MRIRSIQTYQRKLTIHWPCAYYYDRINQLKNCAHAQHQIDELNDIVMDWYWQIKQIESSVSNKRQRLFSIFTFFCGGPFVPIFHLDIQCSQQPLNEFTSLLIENWYRTKKCECKIKHFYKLGCGFASQRKIPAKLSKIHFNRDWSFIASLSW